MHLLFSTPDIPALLHAGERVKFVMIGPSRSTEPDDAITLIFSAHDTHAVRAAELLRVHRNLDFVGGGKIESRSVWWESNTCQDTFGYDKPEGNATAELLLQTLDENLHSQP